MASNAAQVKAAIENIAREQQKGVVTNAAQLAGTLSATRAKTQPAQQQATQPQEQTTRPAQAQTNPIIQEQQRRPRTQPAQVPITKAFSKLGQKLNPRTAQQPKQSPAIEQLPAQRQQQQPEQIPEQETVQQQRFRSGTTPKFKLPVPPIPTSILPLPKTSRFSPAAEGYDVYVRRKGEFKKANKEPLTRKEAFGFGATDVANTAAASFKLEKAGRPATGRFKTLADQRDFYASQREPGVFVQKQEARIKTLGELRDITYEGIQANKGKRKGGIFG